MGRVIITLAISLIIAGCGSFFLGDDPADDPETVFEEFWQSYDRYYAHFELKGIDWDGIYAQYRLRVGATTEPEELFEILARMIHELEDGHVYLRGLDRLAYSNSHLRGQRRNFDAQLVEEVYLQGSLKTLASRRIRYGWLSPEVAYLRLTTLDAADKKGWAEDIDKAITVLGGAKGLVLDLRSNSGGHAMNATFVASRFATKRKPFLVTRSRNGPAHHDFSKPRTWFVEPPASGPSFTGPLVVLTDRHTFSAAEWLTLALREYEHITHMGTHTGGGLAMFLPRELPNGWTYTISIQDTRCMEGRSYEGVGIAPHYYVESDDGDFAAFRDSILEAAMEYLESQR